MYRTGSGIELQIVTRSARDGPVAELSRSRSEEQVSEAGPTECGK